VNTKISLKNSTHSPAKLYSLSYNQIRSVKQSQYIMNNKLHESSLT
jgi:hypothetical protein